MVDVAAFRREARAFLSSQAGPDERGTSALEVFTPRTAHEEERWVHECRRWQQTLFEAGFAGITLPEDVGGRGLSMAHALAWAEEESAFAVPRGLFSVTTEMVAPTLVAVGSPAQRALVVDVLRGQDVWCQLFSEPGAGSDLASVATRARPGDDGGWRITGQKVWTSEADHARWGYLLARTDTDVARPHQGLTAFVVDMQQPGITVRPLRQMSGGSSFNEVFFDDAEVPADGVLLGVGDGWKVAMTTLGFERFTTFARGMHRLVQRAAELGWDEPVGRQELARVVSEHRILGWLEDRLQAGVESGAAPGAEGTLTKLAYVSLVRRLGSLVVQRQGLAGVGAADDWQQLLLAAPGLRLAGGTDEVLRNLVGERVLGLPR